jgi:ribose/xylose/arabinose/galactoside ABC-type transport system permease subunit
MRFIRLWEKTGIYALALMVFMFCWLLLGANFATSFNLINVLMQICLIVIAGIGTVFIITCGLIDMSIGSIYTLTSIAVGVGLTKLNLGVVGSIGLALGIGLVCGLINGLLVTKAKLPPFIATLATMLAFKGASYLVSEGKDILYITRTDFKMISTNKLLGIPNPIWIMLLLLVLGYLIYKKTKFGVYVRSIGSNQTVTRISGIPVNRMIVTCYLISASFAVLGGIVSASRTLIGTSTAGATYGIDCICAVVLGGTSMAGGQGNIIGLFFAALLLGFMKNALNMLNLPFYYQYIVTGVILVFALVMSNLKPLILERRI